MGDDSVQVPLPQYIAEAARESAWTVIKEHIKTCPIGKLEGRVTLLEARFYVLVGAIFGSGVLGGAAGAFVLKMFGE